MLPITDRIQDAATDPLRPHAARSERVDMRVEITERPKPVRAAGFGGTPSGVRSLAIPARVVDAGAIPTTGDVLLFTPVDQWSGLLPGQNATLAGTLAPADKGRLTVAVVHVRGPPSSVSPPPPWQRMAESLRSGLRGAAAVLDEEQAGLLPALVVGDTDRLSATVRDEFRVAGMAHFLAVSGANLAIVGFAVLFLLRLLRAGPRTAAAGAMAAVLGFVVLAGPEPSVLRAGVMGGIGLLALVLGRERSAVPALAASVIVLVALDPGMAVSFGFVLSVLATAGLVLLAPRWADALVRRRVPPGIAEALAVPAAASLVTAPVVAGMSGQVSLVAIAANLVAAPVVAPATVLGVLAALVAPWSMWSAEWLARFAGPEVGWLIGVARHAADIPGAALDWPSGWWGGALLLVVVLVSVVVLRRRRLRVLVGLALTGVLIVVVPIRVIDPAWPPDGWAVVACDVGQGDAIALATAEPDRAVLVDTGPEPGPVGDCLDRLGVTRVPAVVLSHLHADHIGGLATVLAERSVGAVVVGPARSPQWAWRQVRRDTAAAGVPLVELTAGQRLDWPGLRIEVLHPGEGERADEEEVTGTEINNKSLVLRATTAAGRVLLTGDIELAAQADLLTAGADLTADVVKVPHHGSRYTSPEFLAAVRARVALVSAGVGNRYGHPSPRTVQALTAAGVRVARTDLAGDSAVVPAPDGLEVVTRDPTGESPTRR